MVSVSTLTITSQSLTHTVIVIEEKQEIVIENEMSHFQCKKQ